jgi:hypothetical protein
LWKLTELWKNQRTIFPQLLEPSVHTFHNAGCYWSFGHNISFTPPPVETAVDQAMRVIQELIIGNSEASAA